MLWGLGGREGGLLLVVSKWWIRVGWRGESGKGEECWLG